MWWQVGMYANAVIALAYFAIAYAIVKPLLGSHQLTTNRLGAATAAIFFTCAVHHGSHSIHMALPFFDLSDAQGSAMRDAWGWQLGLWDVVGATVAIYYWSLRRNYGSLMQGAKLFEDLREREQQALELNDNVLQGLVVARMALDLGQEQKAVQALDTAITRASTMITDLLGSDRGHSPELLRSSAATLERAERLHHSSESAAVAEEPGEGRA